jgi:hypothetical protein
MLILLFALAATPAYSKSAVPAKKIQLLEQLHKACLKNSFQEGKDQEAACGCLKANYEKKLSEDDLALLARIQNGSITKDELEGKDDLLEFDMEASQHCVEDAAWRWAPVKKAKEGADGEGTEPVGKSEKIKLKAVAKPTTKPKE